MRFWIGLLMLAMLNGELMAQSRVELRADGGLQVDGRPFLPVIVWAQPSVNLPRLKELGANVVHVGEREAKDPLMAYLTAAERAGILVLVDEDRLTPEVRNHPAILAWTVEHEPDMIRPDKKVNDRMPDVQKAKYERMRAEAPGALTWAIYTAGFYDHYRKLPAAQYAEYFRYADVLAFDHYPVTGWNRPDRLPEVGLATREMVRLARPGQPVWTFLEASDQELAWTAKETRGPTPQEMRAEVWSSIANGAKGIGYFTIAFGRGSKFQWMNLTPELQDAMREVNRDLHALAGPIAAGATKRLMVSGDETSDEAAKGHAIHAIQKEYEGRTWIVAVNVTREKVRPSFTMEDGVARELKVWREEGVLPVKAGQFTDDFEPLAVHIYTEEQE